MYEEIKQLGQQLTNLWESGCIPKAEIQILSAKVDWEARRVATAFRVESFFMHPPSIAGSFRYEGISDGVRVSWVMSTITEQGAFQLNIGEGENTCYVHFREWMPLRADNLIVRGNKSFYNRMARGLYCLGYEDDDLLTAMNYTLSSHEQAELHLSMPREFWPQTWLDREKELQL